MIIDFAGFFMFAYISSQITKELSEKKGLFLGFGHKDIEVNKYLANNFSQIVPDYGNLVVFAELEPENFGNILLAFQNMKQEYPDLFSDFDKIYNMIIGINEGFPAASNEFISLVLFLALSGIKVVPFNYQPATSAEKQKKRHYEDILSGSKPSTTMAELASATEWRTSKDVEMACTIEAELVKIDGDASYLILGGPAHAKIPEKLSINAINIMSETLYHSMLVGSHDTVLQNLSSDHVSSYSYRKDLIYLVTWELSEFNCLKAIFNRYTKHQINPNFSPDWGKILRIAAAEGNMEYVRFIVQTKREDVNSADMKPEKKNTALHWAVIKKQRDIAEYLIENGADKGVRNALNKSPEDYIEGGTEREQEEWRNLLNQPLIPSNPF